MINPMRTHLQQNIRTVTTLLAFALLAIIISLIVFSGDGAVSASQLFQSPPPPGQEEPTPKPTPERVLPPTVAPPTAAPPTNTPQAPVEPEPTQPESPEVIEVPTSAPPAPDNAEVIEVPTSAPPAPDNAEVIEVPSPVQPAPANAVSPDEPLPAQPAPAAPARPEVVIDSGLLIDSILVYISYAWLCCGVIMFVMIPIVFLVLYVWGSRRTKTVGN